MTERSSPRETSTAHSTPTLSPAGRARRDDMLAGLQGEMRRTHASRRMRRVLAINAALIACVVGSFMVINRPSRTSSPANRDVAIGAAPQQSSSESASIQAPIRIETVTTPANLLDRYAVATSGAPRVETLTDDELLSTLASLDRPTGLVRTDGRSRLTRMVADPAAPMDSPNSSS